MNEHEEQFMDINQNNHVIVFFNRADLTDNLQFVTLGAAAQRIYDEEMPEFIFAVRINDEDPLEAENVTDKLKEAIKELEELSIEEHNAGFAPFLDVPPWDARA